jgi:hypothetical protein
VRDVSRRHSLAGGLAIGPEAGLASGVDSDHDVEVVGRSIATSPGAGLSVSSTSMCAAAR